MKTYLLRISGKVQGVWYRASAKDEALRLGIMGEVWNEPNGDVGAHVQGDDQQITQFIAWCWQGPPLADVTAVDQQEIEMEPFVTFNIVRYGSRRRPAAP